MRNSNNKQKMFYVVYDNEISFFLKLVRLLTLKRLGKISAGDIFR